MANAKRILSSIDSFDIRSIPYVLSINSYNHKNSPVRILSENNNEGFVVDCKNSSVILNTSNSNTSFRLKVTDSNLSSNTDCKVIALMSI